MSDLKSKVMSITSTTERAAVRQGALTCDNLYARWEAVSTFGERCLMPSPGSAWSRTWQCGSSRSRPVKEVLDVEGRNTDCDTSRSYPRQPT